MAETNEVITGTTGKYLDLDGLGYFYKLLKENKLDIEAGSGLEWDGSSLKHTNAVDEKSEVALYNISIDSCGHIDGVEKRFDATYDAEDPSTDNDLNWIFNYK